jgi:hypothetical protein
MLKQGNRRAGAVSAADNAGARGKLVSSHFTGMRDVNEKFVLVAIHAQRQEFVQIVDHVL